MFTFADLMRQAQGGQALDNVAAATGLDRKDVERLTATLLPVFQLAMQRAATQRPTTLASLSDPKTFRAAFDDANAAVSPAMIEAGRMVMEKLFGSRDAAEVVAEQAAAINGIGADVVGRAMPTIAATLFGGLAKQIEASPLAPLLKAWADGVDPAVDPVTALSKPYQSAMGAFMKGFAEGKEKPKPAPQQAWPQGMEALGRMFEAGVELSEQHRRAFEQILDGKRQG